MRYETINILCDKFESEIVCNYRLPPYILVLVFLDIGDRESTAH